MIQVLKRDSSSLWAGSSFSCLTLRSGPGVEGAVLCGHDISTSTQIGATSHDLNPNGNLIIRESYLIFSSGQFSLVNLYMLIRSAGLLYSFFFGNGMFNNNQVPSLKSSLCLWNRTWINFGSDFSSFSFFNSEIIWNNHTWSKHINSVDLGFIPSPNRFTSTVGCFSCLGVNKRNPEDSALTKLIGTVVGEASWVKSGRVLYEMNSHVWWFL